MKPLLTPTAVETLRTMRQALEDWVRPATQGSSAYSYATTVIALCHHVETRVELEGQQLFDEIARLRPLLSGAAEIMERHPRGGAVAADIRQTLVRERDPQVYPTLSATGDEVAQLRQHICDVQDIIIAEDEAGVASAEIKVLRADIRDYIGWQLDEQRKIVEPAFRGRGPRR